MVGVSKRIKLEMMRETLGMNQKDFNNKIWSWAEKFNFTIDGDYILVENADIDGFIRNLDEQFSIWTKHKDNGEKD